MSIEKPSSKSGRQEIADTELEKVSGGTDTKPATPTTTTTTTKPIGSQSTGAGAGKIGFNPF